MERGSSGFCENLTKVTKDYLSCPTDDYHLETALGTKVPK